MQAKLLFYEFAPYAFCLMAVGVPPAAACAWLRGLETRDLCSDHSLAWRTGTCCSLAEIWPYAPACTGATGACQGFLPHGPYARRRPQNVLQASVVARMRPRLEAKRQGVTAKTLGTQRKRRRASVQGSRTIPARRSSLIGSSSWQDRWKVSLNSPVFSAARFCLVSNVDRGYFSCSRSVPSTRRCKTQTH